MKCEPPEFCQLIAPRESLNFLDCRLGPCVPGTTALQAYRLATLRSPRALTAAFAVRDRISALFGVANIGGFDDTELPSEPAAGDLLHFFTVEMINNAQLVLTAKDVHLETMLSIDIAAIGNGPVNCYITSSVITKNAFGVAYMVPVAAVHGLIVERLLRNLSPVQE